MFSLIVCIGLVLIIFLAVVPALTTAVWERQRRIDSEEWTARILRVYAVVRCDHLNTFLRSGAVEAQILQEEAESLDRATK